MSSYPTVFRNDAARQAASNSMASRLAEPFTYNRVHTTEARANLLAWDRGDTVWLVEMGGLGPGYEQCIAIMTMEFVRAMLDKRPKTRDALDRVCMEALKPIDKQLGGTSGAQYGAAMGAAARLVLCGWGAMVGVAPSDRHIQVDKGFPSLTARDGGGS